MDVALGLKHIVETNPLVLYKVLIHCNSCLKQLYSSDKMEWFSYKGGCGVREFAHIEAFKRKVGLGYRRTVSAYYYLKQLYLKQYCMCCYVTLSNVFYLMHIKMCIHYSLLRKLASKRYVSI